jgi:hypothetical protein
LAELSRGSSREIASVSEGFVVVAERAASSSTLSSQSRALEETVSYFKV